MGDSIPYPYNLAYVLFWQGLLYNEKNLDYLYEKALKYSQADLDSIKRMSISRVVIQRAMG